MLNIPKINTKFIKHENKHILSIIYMLYSYYLSNSSFKEEIIINICYFLINEFNNPAYAMYLCSKIKLKGHKNIYNKYLLIMEDIKEYLTYQLKKNSKKELIKNVQIGKVILYYLYTDLFRTKIYDALNNQIDYFEILKSKTITYKITHYFLKFADNILKLRKEIIFIWKKKYN